MGSKHKSSIEQYYGSTNKMDAIINFSDIVQQTHNSKGFKHVYIIVLHNDEIFAGHVKSNFDNMTSRRL